MAGDNDSGDEAGDDRDARSDQHDRGIDIEPQRKIAERGLRLFDAGGVRTQEAAKPLARRSVSARGKFFDQSHGRGGRFRLKAIDK
jgi:hypothetical protein